LIADAREGLFDLLGALFQRIGESRERIVDGFD